MNFKDLLTKMKSIDEGTVAECGGMEIMPMSGMGREAPKQSDSVTMNVSMNGSGVGGIRDLMAALKQIDNPEHGHNDDDAALFGAEPEGHEVIIGDMDEETSDGGFGDATTSPDQHTADISAVTPTGDDMHSKGGERPKVNGGGNPMQEALVSRLSQMYSEIKEGKKEKEPEGTYSSKRHETDGQRIARLAKEKRQAQNKERMKNDFNAEMER